MSLCNLQMLRGKLKHLCESILRNEETSELFENLYKLPEIDIYGYQLLLAELLQLHCVRDLQLESLMLIKNIQRQVDEEISCFHYKMVCNRLINESATYESIGDLYNLPHGCLMMIVHPCSFKMEP